jgi:hypothetical protein
LEQAMATGPLASPNTTLDTVEDYISDARVLLLDTNAPFRYDDPSLLEALNVMLLEGRRLRADLYVHNRRLHGKVPHYTINDNSLVPIEEQFRLAFLYGLCGHAIARDQEDIQDERAVWFMNTMSNILTGKNIVTPQQSGG